MGGEIAVQIEIPIEARARPNSADSEEAVWLARARRGDEAAIGWLIARYRLRAVRLATHIMHRSDEAEDAAQEAFIRAFRSLGAFRGEGRFYTWLYQIVVRTCLDRMRIRRWDLETPFEPGFEPTYQPMEGVETRVLVERLMDQLSPPMRAALMLRELEGLDYEEIARVLNIPVGRVRWRLHEARERFRGIWRAAMQETDHV